MMGQRETKQQMYAALEGNGLDALVEYITSDRKAVSQLIRFSYDKETLAGWRAIKTMGRIAKRIWITDHEFLRTTVRKLLWSLSDESGGIGWSAPELLGEIVSADPNGFADIIPLIAEVYDIEERTFRPGVMYALYRIAEQAPERVACFKNTILRALEDGDPLVRLYGIRLAGLLMPIAHQLGMWSRDHCNEIVISLNKLIIDKNVVWVYGQESFIDVEVGYESKIVADSLMGRFN